MLRLGRNAGEFRVGEVSVEEIVATITGAKDNVVARRAARHATDAAGVEHRRGRAESTSSDCHEELEL